MWLRRAVRTVDHVEQDIPGKPPPSQRKFWRGWSHGGGPAAPTEPAHVREAGVWGLQVAGGLSNSNGVTEEPQPPRASCLCSGVPPWLRKSFAPYCTLKTPTRSSEPSTEVAPEAWPLRGKARGTQQPGTAAHARTISVGACAGGCPVSLCPPQGRALARGAPGHPREATGPLCSPPRGCWSVRCPHSRCQQPPPGGGTPHRWESRREDTRRLHPGPLRVPGTPGPSLHNPDLLGQTQA
ncbi:uncharacterized protein LOC114672199 [Macaca mulatta]